MTVPENAPETGTAIAGTEKTAASVAGEFTPSLLPPTAFRRLIGRQGEEVHLRALAGAR